MDHRLWAALAPLTLAACLAEAPPESAPFGVMPHKFYHELREGLTLPPQQNVTVGEVTTTFRYLRGGGIGYTENDTLQFADLALVGGELEFEDAVRTFIWLCEGKTEITDGWYDTHVPRMAGTEEWAFDDVSDCLAA